MPVGYEMRWFPTEADVLRVFERLSRLPPVIGDEDSDSREYALVFLFRFAFSNKKRRAAIFFTVQEVNCLR